MPTVETGETVQTVETNIPTYTILKYSKEVFHMKVISIFNCQHVGVSMININTQTYLCPNKGYSGDSRDSEDHGDHGDSEDSGDRL